VLEAVAVAGPHGDAGVEVEAVDLGAPGVGVGLAPVRDGDAVAVEGAAGAGTDRDAPGDGGGEAPGQDGLGERQRVGLLVGAVFGFNVLPNRRGRGSSSAAAGEASTSTRNCVL
jgi:hypothetical protein